MNTRNDKLNRFLSLIRIVLTIFGLVILLGKGLELIIMGDILGLACLSFIYPIWYVFINKEFEK